MKTTLCALVLLTFWLLPGPTLAGDGETPLAAARTDFAAGRYAAAAGKLEIAYADGARNAGCCLAAATAWQLANDRGRTVLWLARASRLDPGNPNVQHALVAADVAMPGPILPLAGRFSPRALLWLALGGNIAFWLGLLLARRMRRRVPVAVLVLVGLVVGWLWLEAGTATLAPRLQPEGVILTPVPVRCAPEPEAEILFSLPAGQIVALGPARDGYRQIEAGPDRLGWLPARTVADITP